MSNAFFHRLINLKDRFFLTSAERVFFALTRSLLPKTELRTQDKLKILIQMPEDYFYVILFSSLIRSLSKKVSLQIGWINLNVIFEQGGIKNFLRNSKLYSRHWDKLYLSNCGEVVYRHSYITSQISKQTMDRAKNIFDGFTSKEDVLLVSDQGIELGDLIYDTYLRYKPAATINLKDAFLQTLVTFALDQVQRQAQFFSVNKYDVLFTSYSSYIHHGVMVRSALKAGVKVISFGNYDQLAKQIQTIHPSHFKDFYRYRDLFASLPENIQKQGIEQARSGLNSRFKGAIDSSTFYMSKSAFHVDSGEKTVFEANGKKRVVIFLHDFFDSPHIHRFMHYADFHDWVFATAKILTTKGDCDVFIKPHPNGVKGNDEITQELLTAFPKLKLISKTVSNLSLIKEGFDLALTVYGTLGHEFPYFGIRVLNGGDNPHINYDFSVHPKSRDEYESFLKNLDKIPFPNEFAQKQIHEFYFMHNFFQLPGKIDVRENSFINTEIRNLPTKESFQKFLGKYKDSAYRERLDRNILSSIKDFDLF